MASEELKREIEDNFIDRWVRAAQHSSGHSRTDYKEVENVRDIDYVINRYINSVINLTEQERHHLLDRMDQSLTQNHDHGFWERWLWACVGVARYLLKCNTRDEIERRKAADVIVRLSRWFYTNNNFWIRFRPTAREIVTTIWQNIENLYPMDRIN